jgi:hypothetical protein
LHSWPTGEPGKEPSRCTLSSFPVVNAAINAHNQSRSTLSSNLARTRHLSPAVTTGRH